MVLIHRGSFTCRSHLTNEEIKAGCSNLMERGIVFMLPHFLLEPIILFEAKVDSIKKTLKFNLVKQLFKFSCHKTIQTWTFLFATGVYSVGHHICHEAVFPRVVLQRGGPGGPGGGVCASRDRDVSGLLWGEWGEGGCPARLAPYPVTTVLRLRELDNIIPGRY